MKESIILIQALPPMQSIFSTIFEQMGIDLQIITQKDYHTPLKEILSLSLDSPISKEEARLKAPTLPATLTDIGEPILLFSNFTRPRLQSFLEIMRQIEAPTISLKAMLTPVNQYWTPLELYVELSQEREYFRSQKKD